MAHSSRSATREDTQPPPGRHRSSPIHRISIPSHSISYCFSTVLDSNRIESIYLPSSTPACTCLVPSRAMLTAPAPNRDWVVKLPSFKEVEMSRIELKWIEFPRRGPRALFINFTILRVQSAWTVIHPNSISIAGTFGSGSLLSSFVCSLVAIDWVQLRLS